MKNNKHAKAFRSMNRLRAHPIIAARDFYYSCVIYEEEKKVAGGSGYFSRLWDCFAVPRIRRANYGASTVMIAQQMCGINSMLLSIPSNMEDLTRDSHFILQFNDLRGSWLYSNSGIVCFSRLRRHSSLSYHPYCIHDRYQRTKNSNFGDVPGHVYLFASSRPLASESPWKQRRSDWASGLVSFPSPISIMV